MREQLAATLWASMIGGQRRPLHGVDGLGAPQSLGLALFPKEGSPGRLPGPGLPKEHRKRLSCDRAPRVDSRTTQLHVGGRFAVAKLATRPENARNIDWNWKRAPI